MRFLKRKKKILPMEFTEEEIDIWAIHMKREEIKKDEIAKQIGLTLDEMNAAIEWFNKVNASFIDAAEAGKRLSELFKIINPRTGYLLNEIEDTPYATEFAKGEK